MLHYYLVNRGPIFIKFGQILSTQYSLFHINTIEELIPLQDRVLCNNTNVDLSQIDYVLESVESEPISAGSIAMVFKGILKNGDKVAIKIKHENLTINL